MLQSLTRPSTQAFLALLVVGSAIAAPHAFVNENFTPATPPSYLINGSIDVLSTPCQLFVQGMVRVRPEADRSANPASTYHLSIGTQPALALNGQVLRFGAYAETRVRGTMAETEDFYIFGDELPLGGGDLIDTFNLNLPTRLELLTFALFMDLRQTGGAVKRIWYKDRNGQNLRAAEIFRLGEDQIEAGRILSHPGPQSPVYWGRPVSPSFQ